MLEKIFDSGQKFNHADQLSLPQHAAFVWPQHVANAGKCAIILSLGDSPKFALRSK